MQQNEEFNQRAMKAVILCMLVALLYSNWLLPKKQPVAPPQQQVVTQQGAVTGTAAPSAAAPVQPAPVGAPQVAGVPPMPVVHVSKTRLTSAPTTFVQSDKFQFSLSHLGGRALGVKLVDYKAKHGSPELLDLVNSPEGAVFPLGVYAGAESDETVEYSLVSIDGAPVSSPTANVTVAPGSTLTVEFKGKLPSGNGITKRLRFTDGSYMIGVEVALDQPAAGGQPVWLEWSHYYPAAEETARTTPSHLTYLDGFDKIKHVPLTELPMGVRDFGTSRWAAIGDMYFMATLIPTVSGRNTMLGHEGEVYLSRVAGGPSGGAFSVYAGPKEYKTLRAIEGLSLERAIDLGWFSFLAFPLLRLLEILYSGLHNYGLAIIGLTLIVKSVLLPLSKASFDSMKKMQELQPEIKALKERVKDPTQLNQEIFALYQRRGVNPMGGCFPMLIQIPVFLGLYQALLSAIDLRHANFGLWITDLSSPERLELFGIGIPVMVLLMAASMIVQQRTMPNTSIDPMQQKMMTIMPFIFAGMFIIFPMPAGLVLYWLVNNLISITQQVYMRNTDKGSVYVATVVASVLIFGAGYLVTLI